MREFLRELENILPLPPATTILRSGGPILDPVSEPDRVSDPSVSWPRCVPSLVIVGCCTGGLGRWLILEPVASEVPTAVDLLTPRTALVHPVPEVPQ